MILSQISPKLKRKASNQAFWPNLNPSLACSLITLWTMQVPNKIEDISNQGNLETWFFEIGLKLTLVTNSNRVFIRFTAIPFATFYEINEINEKMKITKIRYFVCFSVLLTFFGDSQSKRGSCWVESIWLAIKFEIQNKLSVYNWKCEIKVMVLFDFFTIPNYLDTEWFR